MELHYYLSGSISLNHYEVPWLIWTRGWEFWLIPWRWHILSIPLKAGRGIRANDLGSGLYTPFIIIVIIIIIIIIIITIIIFYHYHHYHYIIITIVIVIVIVILSSLLLLYYHYHIAAILVIKINSFLETYIPKVGVAMLCVRWYDSVIVFCLVSNVHYNCIFQNSLYQNMDIMDIMHCSAAPHHSP